MIKIETFILKEYATRVIDLFFYYFKQKSSSFNKVQGNGKKNPSKESIEAVQNEYDQSSCENQQARQRKGIPGRTIQKTKNVVRFVLIEQDAHVVDRVSRVAFPLGYLLFNIVYWLYYSLGSFH